MKPPTDIANWTNQQVMDELVSRSPLNRARQVFPKRAAKIGRYCACDPIVMRRMEFEAVQEIAATLGVTI